METVIVAAAIAAYIITGGVIVLRMGVIDDARMEEKRITLAIAVSFLTLVWPALILFLVTEVAWESTKKLVHWWFSPVGS